MENRDPVPVITDWLQFTSGPLTLAERERILAALWRAHVTSSTNNEQNASNVAVMVSAAASGSVANALVSAIAATGGRHAPVTQARRQLYREKAPDKLPERWVVPGFGNSFFKDRIDPAWDSVVALLRSHANVWGPIETWQALFRAANKGVHPNAAAFTAAVAELVGWPEGLEPVLVIQPRISVWAAVFQGVAEVTPQLQ